MSETRTAPAEAVTRRSRWPGWIWSVPIAAVGIAVWLLVRMLAQGGTDITITFDDAHGVDPDSTNIEYRGTHIGKVTGVKLTGDGHAVSVSAHVQDDASRLLTTGTVFWLRGTHPSVSNLSSLGAILSGPTIVLEPGPGPPATHFDGLTRKPLAPSGEAPALFIVQFAGPVGGLSPGDSVKLRGFSIGEVKAIGFHYDVTSGAIETPVTLALYPSLLHIEGAPQPSSDATLRSALDRLIEEGLRARLDRDPPLIGGYRVALDMVPGAPAAEMAVANGVPQIPTAADGGLQSIVTRLNKIPLEEIAQNVLDITHHVDQIASSPQLRDSIVQLDASLQDVRRTVTDVGPKVDKLVQTLRETGEQLDRTAQAADKTIGGAASQNSLRETLREIEEAAQAVRSLADYLDRHPEALIAGRPGD